MLRWRRILPVVLSAALIGLLLWDGRETEIQTAGVYALQAKRTLLIIDAGHGGEDGGAVSLTGAYESQINLAIALRLDQIMGLYGMPALLLRDRDISLHSEGANTLREKKVSDLHNRVDMVEQQTNAVLLSIHQNSYPTQRYSGAQVFFSPVSGSEELAQLTQEVLRQALNPNNGRKAKKIPDSIYLMNHISCPAILVECGFLTNPQEEQLLQSSSYQCKLAAALAGAWMQYQQGNTGAGSEADLLPASEK